MEYKQRITDVIITVEVGIGYFLLPQCVLCHQFQNLRIKPSKKRLLSFLQSFREENVFIRSQVDLVIEFANKKLVEQLFLGKATIGLITITQV